MPEHESPVEVFKRATTAAIRAIAERDDIQVGFSAEPPGIAGTRVRVPMPARDLNPRDVASLRGAADAVALRLRHHDSAVHAQRMPTGDTARAAFDALEQARCEAIGARSMAGVAANLGAALEERYRRQGFERATERDQVPLAEVMRLLARELLTGAPPPASARQAVEIWRPWVEERIGREFATLGRLVDDQDAYAREVRRLLSQLDMEVGGEPEPEESEDDEERDGEQNENEPNDGQTRGGEEATGQTETMPDPDNRDTDGDEDSEGAAEDADAETAEG